MDCKKVKVNLRSSCEQTSAWEPDVAYQVSKALAIQL